MPASSIPYTITFAAFFWLVGAAALAAWDAKTVLGTSLSEEVFTTQQGHRIHATYYSQQSHTLQKRDVRPPARPPNGSAHSGSDPANASDGSGGKSAEPLDVNTANFSSSYCFQTSNSSRLAKLEDCTMIARSLNQLVSSNSVAPGDAVSAVHNTCGLYLSNPSNSPRQVSFRWASLSFPMLLVETRCSTNASLTAGGYSTITQFEQFNFSSSPIYVVIMRPPQA